MNHIDAYLATVYVLSPPGRDPVSVRLDDLSTELDGVLAGVGVGTWGFVTAWNPNLTVLTTAENEDRHRLLSGAVSRLGIASWPAVGLGHSGGPTEPGLAVLGVTKAAVADLGRQFGQVAVIHGVRGAIPDLVLLQ